jgi:hypothetical protein
MIAQFAISQQKLKNAKIIDRARIVDLAVDTAQIELLAVNTGIIGLGVIVNAHVGDAEIQSAKIFSVAAEKIVTGTITVGAGGMTFSGTGGIAIIGGGGILCSPGAITATTYSTVVGGWYDVPLPSIGGGFKIGGTVAIDYQRNFDAASKYSVGGTQVIGAQGAAVADTSVVTTETADATYDANEASMLNNLKTDVTNLTNTVNTLKARLRAHGVIA